MSAIRKGVTAVLCAVLLSLAMGTGQCAAQPLISANRTATPPAIDGRADAVWQQAPAYNGFYMANGKQVTAGTSLRLLYDEKNFYILYVCEEPRMGEVKANPAEHDGSVWADDTADFFLIPNPGTSPTAYHLIANLCGSRYDEKITAQGTRDKSWNGDWIAAGSRGEKSWTLEICVPWAALGGMPPGKMIEANFGRVRKTVSEVSATVATGGMPNTTRKVSVKLAEGAPGIENITWKETAGGKASVKFTLQGTTGTGKVFLEVSRPGGRVAARYINVVAGKADDAELTFTVPERAEERTLQLAASMKDGKDICYTSAPYAAKGIEKDLAVDMDEIYYYPDEAITVKLANKTAGTLALTITRQGTGKTLRKVAGKVAPGKREIKISPKELFGEGVYNISATLAAGPGQARQDSVKFGIVPRAEWPRVSVKNVTIGKEGGILVNGAPYFPVIMYHAEVEDYPATSYLGFNSVMAGWWDVNTIRKQLDAAQQAGILCNIGLPDRGYGDRLGKRENVEAKVKGLKDHPALLFYHLMDEPTVSYYPTLEKGYNFVKELDSNHIQFCTLPNFLGYADSVIDAAGRTRDIYAPDLYPFDTAPVTSVSSGVRMCVAAAKRSGWKKSVIYIGPCFEWLPIYRIPNPDELRLTAYLALINGAKGLGWFSYRETVHELKGDAYGFHVPQASRIRSCFKRLNGETARLSQALCAPTPAQYFTAEAKGGFEYKLVEGPGEYYLMAANSDATGKTATFRQKAKAPVPEGRIGVLSEDRSVAMKNGEFTDTFGPHAVHVYVIKKK